MTGERYPEIDQRDENGQILPRKHFTEKQQIFIDKVVAGATQTEAARAAGYSGPGNQAYHLMRLPHVAMKIREEMLAQIGTEGVSVAWNTLKEVMTDKTAPAAARVAAADKTLKAAGVLDRRGGAGDKNTKPVAEWSIPDIEQAMAEIKKSLDNVPDIVDITPENREDQP